MTTIEVLLAEDHPLVREGVRNALQRCPDLRLVGETSTAEETQQQCHLLQPHILLLDLKLPGPHPLATLKRLGQTCPKTSIVVLSGFVDLVPAPALVAAGIDGYVLKDEASESLVAAIRVVAAGGQWFSRAIRKQLGHPAEVPAVQPTFTGREQEVLQLLARGWADDRIAEELKITTRTVHFHVQNICEKLNCTRSAAIAWAAKRGWGDE